MGIRDTTTADVAFARRPAARPVRPPAPRVPGPREPVDGARRGRGAIRFETLHVRVTPHTSWLHMIYRLFSPNNNARHKLRVLRAVCAAGACARRAPLLKGCSSLATCHADDSDPSILQLQVPLTSWLAVCTSVRQGGFARGLRRGRSHSLSRLMRSRRRGRRGQKPRQGRPRSR